MVVLFGVWNCMRNCRMSHVLLMIQVVWHMKLCCWICHLCYFEGSCRLRLQWLKAHDLRDEGDVFSWNMWNHLTRNLVSHPKRLGSWCGTVHSPLSLEREHNLMAYIVIMLRIIFGLRYLEKDSGNFVMQGIVICIFQLILLCSSIQGQHAWQKYIHTKLLME